MPYCIHSPDDDDATKQNAWRYFAKELKQCALYALLKTIAQCEISSTISVLRNYCYCFLLGIFSFCTTALAIRKFWSNYTLPGHRFAKQQMFINSRGTINMTLLSIVYHFRLGPSKRMYKGKHSIQHLKPSSCPSVLGSLIDKCWQRDSLKCIVLPIEKR